MATNNSDALTSSLTTERMSKFDQLIEHLYAFYFTNRKAQYLLYAFTFLVSVAYASIGVLVLGRTEQSVVFDCVVLAIIFVSNVAEMAWCADLRGARKLQRKLR